MATMELHKLRHRRAHSGSSSVESDYGPQKTHSSTGTDLPSTSPPAYSDTSVISDSDVPPPESTDPHYKTYSVHNLDMQNITLHANQDGPALYTIINSTFTAGAHSVVLHAGPRTTPPIGAANISTFKGTNQFGVRTGASTALEGMEGMAWEELRRTSSWTHGTYAFEWMWADGERRKYEWRRTSSPLMLDDQADMELVEKGREGMVLARYTRGALIRWTVRARLGVRILNSEGEDEWERWQTVVLLTVMTLVEMSRRRARQRKSP
ncbi:hypothetical protein V499_06143 [Pseudogymnoascus sp. VKM F-103]|uniref:Uncharacterized protein n=1 Tax=Pseudogymnoascus verrucosus TaxID=342668 RepID=A0A1B8GJR5_9PEZI|nr:uncharacterized protein VE01_06703 [Pseudogymnoascus verrucosus]KFY73786.1 hypothetical protein V499_06143 [Pseudogymnoascus sp. VKM F-103]OBT96065.1 hypothetical protein VE01_06703 [Pseudogymnoascus verrucosus]